MKVKLVFIILVPFILFCFAVPVSAAAAGAVVTAGEAMTALEIFDFLAENGLVEVDQLGTYFTPSLFLRTVSGTLDYLNVPVERAPDWLKRIFDVNNQLFWSESGNSVVQLQNGVYNEIDNVGELWYLSDYIDDCGSVPINYYAQLDGYINATYSDNTYELFDVVNNGGMIYGDSFFILGLCTSNEVLYHTNYYVRLFNFNGYCYYDYFDTSTGESLSVQSSTLASLGSTSDLRVGFAPTLPRLRWQISYDNYDSIYNTGVIYPSSIMWVSSSASLSSLDTGDCNYLVYKNKPVCVPTGYPDGNFVYNTDPTNPENISNTVVISPDSEFGNLIDFLQNGFKFTGKFEQTIQSTVTFQGSVSGDLDVTHSGDITINFNDDTKIWSDDGKSTDFGNGVTLDGNAYNDGFSWLIDSVKAVPTVLSSFTFIPSPVISIMSAALVCMVFLGFWRTFKGG